jgi:hypothetical protein
MTASQTSVRSASRGEVTHVGDEPGICRHPGEGAGVGEDHEGGGEGEEGEEPGVPGADPGRSPAEEGEERERGDLEERGGAGTGGLEEGAVEAGEEVAGRRGVVPGHGAQEALRRLSRGGGIPRNPGAGGREGGL